MLVGDNTHRLKQTKLRILESCKYNYLSCQGKKGGTNVDQYIDIFIIFLRIKLIISHSNFFSS